MSVLPNQAKSQPTDVCQYVDQSIGLKSGRTIISAGMPFGMVTPGPHFLNFRSRNKMITDSIEGFSHIHASGVGCGDEWGSIYLMPVSGKLSESQQKSKISGTENTPGYYRGHLDDFGIEAELTATLRTAVHRYTFQQKKQHIIFDISKHLNDKFNKSYINIVSPTSLEGYVSEGAFCSATTELHNIYFHLELDQKPTDFGIFNDNEKLSRQEIKDENIGAWFSFDLPKNSVIEARLGISFVSAENARRNLITETRNISFNNIRESSREEWESLLSRIMVEGPDENDKKMFYSGLYRMLMHPNVFNDVNGEYLSFSHYPESYTSSPFYPEKGTREIRKASGYKRYTLFSLWDTYRTVHPLLTLVYPEYQQDMCKSVLGMYEEKGWLPKWEHYGVETYNMNGAPASIMLIDSYFRGIRDLDEDLIYEAIKKETTVADSTSKERNRPGQEQYLKYGGWIPQDFVMISPPVWGPVSTTLEYNLADWNFAQFCREIGKDSGYEKYMELSKGYKNLFNPEIQLMAPKTKEGEWFKPYDPDKFTMFCETCPFVEGNAWNYSFFVPHDVQGLVGLFKNEDQFVKQLKNCFDKGHFHIGNEPNINFPYLFNFIEGEAHKTQSTVRKILRDSFDATTSGLPGEDDAGTISGWMVYGMMGFYPFCPGDMNYQLTSPVFDKTTIHLNQDFYPGEKFVIKSVGNGPEKIYIDNLKYQGKKLEQYSISHQEMVKGGEIIYELSKER